MDEIELFELKMKGYCCSQIITEICLRKLGMVNNEMVKALAGLCDGMHCGKVCGTLSAATCVMFLAGNQKSKMMAFQLTEWFESVFGSLSCEDLLGNNPLNKVELCPNLILNTLEKIFELFDENGISYIDDEVRT